MMKIKFGFFSGVGLSDGLVEGALDGLSLGLLEGFKLVDGEKVGVMVGVSDGEDEGAEVVDGTFVGPELMDGDTVGSFVICALHILQDTGQPSLMSLPLLTELHHCSGRLASSLIHEQF